MIRDITHISWVREVLFCLGFQNHLALLGKALNEVVGPSIVLFYILEYSFYFLSTKETIMLCLFPLFFGAWSFVLILFAYLQPFLLFCISGFIPDIV